MEEDIKISALSYTNKDFGTMYPEVIGLASQLTNKWDPEHSNESDPGVVLLKEAAFVADHNNYNIDKNVLENFLPSATQDRSVRNILEMNGYVPEYYISAVGKVSFTWNIPNDVEIYSINIPAFTITVTDADSMVTYTQVEDLSLSINANIARGSCNFMQGTIETLSINNSQVITYENIINNRVYLPTTRIAQNGVFIKNTNQNDFSGYWVRNNYLNTEQAGSRVFKVDYDSYKGLPYIEFPDDIVNLIGDGLDIKYFITSGSNGNISANTLVNIISPTDITVKDFTGRDTIIKNTDFIVSNTGSIINGKDPETINEMYNSFKKVVGTFNTLVSIKDYSDRIYSLSDSYGMHLISNGYVTDRRTDYNKSLNVINYDEYGPYFETISLNSKPLSFKGVFETWSEAQSLVTTGDLFCLENGQGGYDLNLCTSPGIYENADNINFNLFSKFSESLTPYDLVVYALRTFSIANFSSRYPTLAYNTSFKPIDEYTLRTIKTMIEDDKCISHTYNDPSSTDVYCFKNYSPLYIMINTYNKVTADERNEILVNIYKALSENFNPRNIEFGSKLSDEEIKKVIIESDSRIKSINEYRKLDEYTTALYNDVGYTEKNIRNSSNLDVLIDLVAKNVLSGRVCLFDFNINFEYKFGQYDGTTVTSNTITTESNITLSSTPYTVKNNEVVQIIYPNYYSEKTFGSYVEYQYTGFNTIPANIEYTLQAGESIRFGYVDEENKKQYYTVSVGDIIKSTFDINPTDEIKTISTGDSISKRVLLKTKLNSSNLQCYWITNPVDGRFPLFNNENVKILNTNEYFIYSTIDLDEFVILGPGTKLETSNGGDSKWVIPSNDVTIESITESGVNLQIPWQAIDFSEDPLYITEMALITLNPGDTINISESSEESELDIGNDWSYCNHEITYSLLGGDSVTLPSIEDFYMVKSRLDFVASTNSPQILYEGQEITLNNISYESLPGELYNIQASPEVITLGGEDINLSREAKFYIYKVNDTDIPSTTISIETEPEEPVEYPFYYKKEGNNLCLIPIYISGNNDSVEITCRIKESLSESYINFSDYNSTSEATSLTLKGNNHYYISPNPSIGQENLILELDWTIGSSGLSETEVILISQPVVADGINPNLNLGQDIPLSSITNRMVSLIGGSDHPELKPYYSFKLDNSIAINNPDFSNPEIMWDINNVANIMTINQIDLNGSTIDISRQMRNY